MSEMIEKVARAICKKYLTKEAPLAEEIAIECAVNICWSDWVDEARAAIKAMREPSEAMIAARFNVLGQGGQAEWHAMIDAALEESK